MEAMALQLSAGKTMNMYERYLMPTIDGLFNNIKPDLAMFMAIAMLRRHVIVSEKDGSYIAYHYAKDAGAEIIINSLYNAFKSANPDSPDLNRKTVEAYINADVFVKKHILPIDLSVNVLYATSDIDREAIPELKIPGFTMLDGVIMPETQMEWATKKTFEHVNIDQHIVDAVYFDQNIILFVGPVNQEPVYIGNILQNDIINVMFADQNFNMLSANTYRLG